MKDDKKSIIKEALTDYNQIMEAADANAKKKLAEEFPDKFNNLLKEEINKNKKSAKESYKKLDESKESEKDDTESNKESVMKKDEKETKKVEETAGKDGVFTEKAKKPAQVKEDVKITDTVGKDDPFTEKTKGVKKIDEEREKDFVGDVENDTPNQGKGELEKGVAFKEKLKGPSSGKPMPNVNEGVEDFDITELDMQSVGSALEGAEEDDEILTMEEIEREISEMEELGQELENSEMDLSSDTEENDSGIAYDQLVEMRNKLDEILNGMGMKEQKNNGGQGANRVNLGGPTQSMIDEITDEEIEAVIGTGEEEEEMPVDEAMGISFSAGTITPGKLGDHEGTHGRFRGRQDESQKKISGLIKENKDLTKKLNEVKKYKNTVSGLLENYKTALEKYRNQLKEMAIFNTNLAHVNNLLVNESLALTQDDKIKIINEFKKVDSITESQKKYKAFLTEMKESRKTLTESIEEKVTTSIQPSSKQKLDEVVEKTAYADDKHIQKMKKLIEYVEKRGKKIIE